MKVPSTLQQLVDDLANEADIARIVLEEPAKAKMIERIIARIVEAEVADSTILLTEMQAVAYTRGYSAEYLRRTIRNYGTRADPRYRKGDLPRHPARTAVEVKRGCTGRIKSISASE
jgi:hypothetical protein